MHIRHRFIHGVTYVFLAHLASVVLLFAGLAIAVRFVSKAEFGNFILLSIAALFLTIVADFGMPSAMIRSLSAEKNKREEIASTSLGFSLLVSLAIFVMVYFLGGAVFSAFDLVALRDLTPFISLLFFFQYHHTRLNAILQGLHLYKRFASVGVAGAVTRSLLILLLVVFFRLQLAGLIIAAVGSVMLSCLLAYLFIPWYVIPKLNFVVLKKLLSFGFPLHINSVLAFVFERTDTIMLGAMLGPVSVGIYEVGYKLPNQIRAFFAAFRSVFFPHLSEYYGNDDQHSAESLLRNALRLVSFVMAGATLLAVLYGREIITILFSSKYAVSAPVFTVLMIGVSAGLCNFLMGTALISSGRPKVILLTSIPEALLNIGGNLLLIPQWGILGAACASAVSRAVVNPIFLLLLGRRRLFCNSWSYLRSYMSLSIACIVFVLLKPASFGGKVIIIVLFVLVAFLLKAFLLSDMKYLLKALLPQQTEAIKDAI